MKFRDGISIIVTVYNKEQFISKTLEAITQQMEKNSQLIVINDGSTDKSELAIKEFIRSQIKDIKYVKQKNTGPSKAVNSAFKFVKYSFIKFVDGDDIIRPDALSYMKSEMERLDLDLLYGHWDWKKNINKFKFKADKRQAYILDNAFKKFLLGGWGGSSNMMIKTSSFKTVGCCDENVFVQDFSIPIRIAGFHTKNEKNKAFKVGQTKKLICVGPSFIENRIISNDAQLLYDLSLATINFLEEHPLINEKLVEKCKNKILSRCWSWERKNKKTSIISKSFLRYILNKVFCYISLDVLRLIVLNTWKNDENIKKISNNKDNKKILVYVGLDLLGDGLLKLPFLKHLKKIFPQSRITWFAGKGESTFNKQLKPLAKDLIFKVKDNQNFGSSLKDIFVNKDFGEYDIIIDTQKRLITTLALKRIKTKVFISSSCKYLFSDITPEEKSEINLSKQLLSLANIFSNSKYEMTNDLKKNKSKKVVICPGASVDWKRWDIKNYIIIGNYLLEKGFQPIFILGPNEVKLSKTLKIYNKLKIKSHKITDPMETIRISKTCKFGISNDTGGGHLIATSGIPLISLFGPTNYKKFAPIGNPKNIVLSSQELYNSDSINKINTSDIISAIERFS